MKSEEIKETTTMYEVLARYGLKPGRGDMISCPFHGADRHASMKIYKDGYHCFACGAHGDIFAFVQEYEHVSFKEAFLILGGQYEHDPKASSKVAIMRRQAQKKTREAQAERLEKAKALNRALITAYRWGIEHNEPMSDAWAENVHALELQYYIFEGLNNLWNTTT